MIVDSFTGQVVAAGGDEPGGLGLDPGGHPPHPAAGAEAGRGAGARGRDGDKRGAPQAAVNSANIGTLLMLQTIIIGDVFTITEKAVGLLHDYGIRGIVCSSKHYTSSCANKVLCLSVNIVFIQSPQQLLTITKAAVKSKSQASRLKNDWI